MQSFSSLLLLLTCPWACGSTSPQSIIRHDSKGSQKSIAVDAAGDLALDVPEKVGLVETDSLRNSGETVGATFHGVSVDVTRSNKSGYTTSTSYCYEQDSASFGNCWAQMPSTSTPACTASSGTAACKCADTPCDIDNLAVSGVTGRCAEKKIYVANGESHSQNNNIAVTGTTENVYCENMVNNNQWPQQGCIATSSDGPDNKKKTGWFCPSGYWTRNGKCYRGKRFLKEECWDGWFSGKCKNSDTSYDEYSTSCYAGQCVPYAFAQQRQRCDCAWLGWNFLVVCSANHNLCGGHACVLNTGDGNKYCDYATSQNWNSFR